MTWSDTPIDGQQSVAANKTPINTAFTYIANKMVSDHTWGSNDVTDGYHSQVSMPKTESGGNPANPAFVASSNTDGIYYVKDKTATDAPDGEFTEPFYISNDGANDQILQLGFRAMMHFEILDVSPWTITEKYAHNCSVARTAEGLFTLTFDTAMPSDNYIVFGTAQRSSSNALGITIQTGTKAANMTTALVKFATSSLNGATARNPITVMIAVCGG